MTKIIKAGPISYVKGGKNHHFVIILIHNRISKIFTYITIFVIYKRRVSSTIIIQWKMDHKLYLFH